MQQNHRNIGRRERLIQRAIEIFDLVDITPGATGKEIEGQFLPSDASLPTRDAKVSRPRAQIIANT